MINSQYYSKHFDKIILNYWENTIILLDNFKFNEAVSSIAKFAEENVERIRENSKLYHEIDKMFTFIDIYISDNYSTQIKQCEKFEIFRELLTEMEHFDHYESEYGPNIARITELADTILDE